MNGAPGRAVVGLLSTPATVNAAGPSRARASSASRRFRGRKASPSALTTWKRQESRPSARLRSAKTSQYSSGLEGADLPLALHHEPHRHRLHPARRQAAGDLRPEQRGHLEADHAVEEPPRLLRVHAVRVYRLGVRERLADGVAGDLVEHHPPEAGGVAAHLLLEVPRDRLPFAVEVGGEIDGLGLAGQPLELADDLLLARQHLVVGAPAVVRIDAHAADELTPRLPLALGRGRPLRGLPPARRRAPFAGAALAADGEVPDVPHARLDEELGTQIAVDGPRLGRRLDDDQGSCH